MRQSCIILVALCAALFLVSCASAPGPEDLKSAEAHNTLGSSHLNSGDLNDAYVEFQKALKLNPQNKETLLYLGYISTKFRKYDDAISYYKRALAVDPHYSDAMNNLGTVYAETGRWDEAIRQFEGALKNPTYSTPEMAYANLGYAHYMKGEYAQAEQVLREALIRNPVFQRAMYFLGLVYQKTGRDDAAIEQLLRLIGIAPDDVDAHWELAHIYLRRGMNAKALKHFRVVAEKDGRTDRIREASEEIEYLKY